ncbi:squalene synthase HpnC [Paracidovorax anthurii]|uniref:Squalene synthase HpnC n=2 Tax=Paracidovorax anthurii TaxID=78229 RepID=A0A328ZR09_9BURK|nr:squalene synthase HpnC [Paracidovorax anthurii]
MHAALPPPSGGVPAAGDGGSLDAKGHPESAAVAPEGPPPRRAQAVTHYENFPVASLLCPPALREPIAAIYAFARTADDIADEGDATAVERLAALQAYARELHAVAAGAVPSARWAQVFGPLQGAMRSHRLPVPLLADLLSAFSQDVVRTSEGAFYADRAELLDYCRRSANPVGRLLLHLYGVADDRALAQSDAICSALQLINFWQDLSVDIPRGRHYLTEADLAAHRVERSAVQSSPLLPEARALVADCAAWARSMMEEGAPLVHRLSGRVGWELRLVVQGGLRILDKVDAMQGESLLHRPTLGAFDWLRMCMRTVAM